ncbi:hypothetical protein OIE62_19375 [Streptomyces scopuliridis]|uniref:Uncharacterized protein n=1 Tax=Streptomyces scopuliridis TaxID=452529 RepID=A0ACD4ZM00_9ACTN|nr:DUF6879 family protein [Streptomyces scopuliridis]WSB35082.1 hypothetical protein OG949_20995 [Streptomyces scopuliridis]WSB99340.1 hypothetical protein OG835_21575 [Streptomyces scopuliridis]WSC06959.1 hypothetical protein OIE62_19375 [Streptomyces scopuliridis]
MSQSLTSFAELLRTAEESAVHLEMRDAYGVENENEEFAAWRKGKRLDPSNRATWWRPWLDLVQEVTNKGVTMRRARIVSEPVSDYIRFEHHGTFTNVAAGEQIRWLPRRSASDLTLPGNDFWLFDGRLVQFNIFDGEGRWVHTDQTEEPAAVRLCASAFEAVWERGVPHEKYNV